MSEVKVLKSTVTDFKDIKFDSPNNPLAKNMVIDFKEMTAEFEFHDNLFTIRLPDKRLIGKFKRLKHKINMKELNEKEANEIEILQDKIIEDMIIGFKLSKYRMDDLEYLQLASLCWDFYVFLQKRLGERGRGYSSSLKVS